MLKKNSLTLQYAAWLVLISAILYAVAIVTGDAGLGTTMLIVIAVVYTVIAWALSTSRRWLSYLTFVIMLCGTVAGVHGYYQSPVFGLIALADACAALLLAVHLWRKPI